MPFDNEEFFLELVALLRSVVRANLRLQAFLSKWVQEQQRAPADVDGVKTLPKTDGDGAGA